MNEVIDIIRTASDSELLHALAMRGAKTMPLKGGKVRVLVKLDVGNNTQPVKRKMRTRVGPPRNLQGRHLVKSQSRT